MVIRDLLIGRPWIAAVLIALVLAGVLTAVSHERGRPACTDCNVVLISIDTLRADHLGAYGYDRNTSPAIDRLAARGTLFENAVAQSPHTLTSHFSMFTSLYPQDHGVRPGAWNERGFSSEFTLLAEVLSRNGYRTFSYNGGANVRGGLGFSRGFDTYRSNYVRQAVHPNGSFENATRFLDDRLTDGSEPFFLFYHTYKPHDPYHPPERYGRMYEGFNASIRERANRKLRAMQRNDSLERPDFRYRWDHLAPRMANSTAWREHMVASYDAEIRYTDRFVGSLLQMLEDRGLRNDTLIVFVSDHGEQFGDHGSWFHWELHRELLHVPLIVDVPGRDGGSVDEFVAGVDVAPTILDLVDASHGTFEEQQRGESLAPLMRGGERAGRYIRAIHHTGQEALIDTERGLRYYNHSVDGFEQVARFRDGGWAPVENATLLAEMARRHDALVRDSVIGRDDAHPRGTVPYTQ